MELWIRNQATNQLLKVACMEVKQFEEGYGIVELIGSGDTGYGLGIYKTKERALEVLDEIQGIIIAKSNMSLSEKVFEKSFDGFNQQQIEKALKTLAVYQMPEE